MDTIKRTPAELKQLAIDIRAGQVFTSLHAPEDMWSHIFMPLIFMGAKEVLEMIVYMPGMMYEYMEKAGPRAINGYPCFFSVNFLDMEDTKYVIEYIHKLEEAERSVL